MQTQVGFFDIATCTAKLTQVGDLLIALNTRIDWEAFRADLNGIDQKSRKSNAGVTPHDVALMFKVLAPRQQHN
jgi:hypothetical protein